MLIIFICDFYFRIIIIWTRRRLAGLAKKENNKRMEKKNAVNKQISVTLDFEHFVLLMIFLLKNNYSFLKFVFVFFFSKWIQSIFSLKFIKIC